MPKGNPHLSITKKSKGSKIDFWECSNCGKTGIYDELMGENAIPDCTYEPPPCKFCGQTPYCAPDTGGCIMEDKKKKQEDDDIYFSDLDDGAGETDPIDNIFSGIKGVLDGVHQAYKSGDLISQGVTKIQKDIEANKEIIGSFGHVTPPQPGKMTMAQATLILQVDENATEEEIKQQYRFLVSSIHPDTHADETRKELAEKYTRKINEAYELLVRNK